MWTVLAIHVDCDAILYCRDIIAQFVSNTFPGPIYPGYAERLAAGKFEVSSSSPGFPVSGEMPSQQFSLTMLLLLMMLLMMIMMIMMTMVVLSAGSERDYILHLSSM